jgi:outer membrane protein OmpA-like peptidoglycan-associated protein
MRYKNGDTRYDDKLYDTRVQFFRELRREGAALSYNSAVMRMRRIWLICWILPMALPWSFAAGPLQDTVLFRDDFDNNSNNWEVVNNDREQASIAGGEFRISYKQARGGTHLVKGVFIDPAQDFYLESKMTQLSGSDGCFGLMWGAGEPGYFAFNITSNGKYRVYSNKRGKISKLVDWRQSDAINRMSKSNVLAVRKTGNQINFLVNDQLMDTAPFTMFLGSMIGFDLTGEVSVAVDHLLVKAPPVKINVVPDAVRGYLRADLGPRINSDHGELNPVISPDGKTLYVVREGHPENLGRQNAWFAELRADGTWGELKNLGRPINNRGANVVISVTPDGNTLLLGGAYDEKGEPAGRGMSMSHRTESGWSIPEKVKIQDYYNNSQFASYCLSADRRILLLSLDRDDSMGSKDLYFSRLQDDGSWSEPRNLGTTVNTFGNDATPFLAADGETLYYATDGKPGYGDMDIFVTRRLDQTWTKWSEPQNLGPEVNGPGFDDYYTVPASGESAYLVSMGKKGDADIFRLKVPETAKPKPVVLVYGKVLNGKTKEPMAADITYHDLNSNEPAGVASSNPVDGSYKIVLPYGKPYGFLANKEGFFPVSDNLDLRKIDKYQEVHRDLVLVPIGTEIPIRLNNIFFDFDKWELKPESYPELDGLCKLLQKHTDIKRIEIAGHTDDVGSDEYNQALSERRAGAVVKYLIQRGIAGTRMAGKGYGKKLPLDPAQTDEARSKNRRVEFKVLE